MSRINLIVETVKPKCLSISRRLFIPRLVQISTSYLRVPGPAPRGSLAPQLLCLAPPINKLTLLKTAALVLNFKLWPLLINAWPTHGPPKSTDLAPALACTLKRHFARIILRKKFKSFSFFVSNNTYASDESACTEVSSSSRDSYVFQINCSSSSSSLVDDSKKRRR